MGTVVSFDVPAVAVADGSLEAALRWLHWVDRVFSPYRPDSDVSLLAAAEVTIDGCAPEVAEVDQRVRGGPALLGRLLHRRPRRRVRPVGLRQGLGGRARGRDLVRRRITEPPGQRRR